MVILATTAATAPEIRSSDVILLIVYLVLLLVGAYYLTKFVSKRAMQKGAKKGPLPGSKSSGNKFRWKQGQMVSVVDRIPIDRDKTIMVVEFENKHYLMATTGQDIKLLDTVDIPQEMETEEEEEQETARIPMQDAASAAEDDSFFKRFWGSFKVVSKNYYKNKNTTPFGIHLRKELDSKEGDEIHPDNGETGSS
jgi:Flagellar biogenesis protein